MVHKTDFGDIPTHLLPDGPETRLGESFAVKVGEGESIPNPASTKRLLHGPSFLICSGYHFYEYNLNDEDPWADPKVAEDWKVDYCRENVPVLDLKENA